MVDSVDELKSSRSGYGKDFPNFEKLDAKIASSQRPRRSRRVVLKLCT